MDNPQGLNTVNSIEYVPEHIHRDNGNIRQKNFRANLSEEHRASINAKKAEKQRKRRAEIKASNPEMYENHLANRREYQRKRYEEMKNAENQLQSGISLPDEDIERLSNLANKRRKLIHTSTVHQQTNKQSRWVKVPQEWDEEYPCQ